jgi:histidyl-tRNA synthetase
MSKFQTVRGMRDFLPKDAAKLRLVEAAAREVAVLYGFEEAITPLVEHHELLTAKSGEEIKARMYAFNDLGGRKIALRPEFTASIARLLATSLRNEPKPLRLFSFGTLYRYDEPQFGRYREFWQSNFEIFGSSRPEADAEVLALTNHLMQKTQLHRYWLKIGHVGILRGLLSEEGVREEKQNFVMQLLDAKRYDEALKTAKELGVSVKGMKALKKALETKGKDVSKVLAQATKGLEGYSSSVDAVDNLGQILELCAESGLEFDFLIEAGFARGLEYYTGMVFEVLVPEVDVSLCGGGRYDRLVELFGGEPTPAVGVAHGLDRIQLVMEKQGIAAKPSRRVIAIIPIGEETIPKALAVAHRLRKEGIATEVEVMGRTVSRALKDADRRGADHAVILGPKELKEGKATLRNLKSREQQIVDIEKLSKELLAKKT